MQVDAPLLLYVLVSHANHMCPAPPRRRMNEFTRRPCIIDGGCVPVHVRDEPEPAVL